MATDSILDYTVEAVILMAESYLSGILNGQQRIDSIDICIHVFDETNEDNDPTGRQYQVVRTSIQGLQDFYLRWDFEEGVFYDYMSADEIELELEDEAAPEED